MTASTIARAANDPDLIARVTAIAQREVVFNDELAQTTYGGQLRAGVISVAALMWPVAVDTEAAYETAVNSGRGAPGHDVDIIPDAALTSAVTEHWPYTDQEIEDRKPFSVWRSDGLTGVVNVYQCDTDASYQVDWGDEAIGDLVIDSNGEGEAAHDYAAAGTYQVAVTDVAGPIKGSTMLTVVEPTP